MLCTAFRSTLPFEDGACANKTAANPATRPKDATRPFRFIQSPVSVEERLPQRDAPNKGITLIERHDALLILLTPGMLQARRAPRARHRCGLVRYCVVDCTNTPSPV